MESGNESGSEKGPKKQKKKTEKLATKRRLVIACTLEKRTFKNAFAFSKFVPKRIDIDEDTTPGLK